MPDFDDTDPTLCANTREYIGSSAFADDKLNRKPLAVQLTGYLERLNDGAVLAIDAPWGEGKTWFGRNWAKYLEDEAYKVIYIDTFEQDYVEDPFMLITSEILNLMDDDTELEENLKKGSLEVGKALLPLAGKVLVNMGGRILLGSSDVSAELGEALEAGTTSAADITSELIKDSLESYSNDKIVMQEFKTHLSEYAQHQEKPIVIFIDELDRCKPDFAVKLVERIKHFFDVPNIIFVLLLNRDQLEKAVKGVYGSETNASAYLGKFVNFFFLLPKVIQTDHNSELRLKQFIDSTMKKYKFRRENEHDSFVNHLKFWAPRLDLSLRDIEKSVALYAFAYPVDALSYILTYLIVLKVKHPEHFSLLLAGDIEAHKKAKSKIEQLQREAEENGNSQHLLAYYFEWHEAYINGFTELGEHFGAQLQNVWHIDKKELFKILAKKIELNIEN